MTATFDLPPEILLETVHLIKRHFCLRTETGAKEALKPGRIRLTRYGPSRNFKNICNN